MSEVTIIHLARINHVISNVFGALELPNGSKEWQKVSLVKRINQALSSRSEKQDERAEILGVSPSIISDLERYELAGISVERLKRYAIFLGITELDSEILPAVISHEH